MENRREFLKKATVLAAGTSLLNSLPSVIQKAYAIDPAPGSTVFDAEHVVFLMQENRSFDHVFGNLKGVRGFNDPRALELPNGNKVWLQQDKKGNTYMPFHLDIANTKVAWMGDLPHNWTDQVDANNNGAFDKWLHVKNSRHKEYNGMPLTLGYCDRTDFPFYYAMADAFTVCDQNFCSAITCTHPNRLYWMTGTIRGESNPASIAQVTNNPNYREPILRWKTFPERLEEEGVSWKVYQNETTMGFGLNGEGSAWLSNFGTNVLEYFEQYQIRLHPEAIANMSMKRKEMLKSLDAVKKHPKGAEREKMEAKLALTFQQLIEDEERYTLREYEKLSPFQKNINSKAFGTNKGDANYHELEPFKYADRGIQRELNIPKGDVLHQFRKDVENGSLPTVSWLMTPANFSDHPGAPWFGPWYVSEVMEILIKNPEIWKKTVFIMTYDENDGYFDHIPPFMVPDPYQQNTGKVSKGIDPRLDFATAEQHSNPSGREASKRAHALGLGYRVPMIVASPWSRGGLVNSEVFDHTSSLRFLETFLDKKFNKKVEEENITTWRRGICGDLTSCFRPYNGENLQRPDFLKKNTFFEGIHQAKFKQSPDNYRALTKEEITLVNKDVKPFNLFPKQEPGLREACALPYEIYSNGYYDHEQKKFVIHFKNGSTVFGDRTAGVPFYVYGMNVLNENKFSRRDFALLANDEFSDYWLTESFEHKNYDLRLYGPNGFYRTFKGNDNNPNLRVSVGYEQGHGSHKLTGNLMMTIENQSEKLLSIQIVDRSYGCMTKNIDVPRKASKEIIFDLQDSFNWYDYSVLVENYEAFEERFAGRVETGLITKTDPMLA